MFGLNVELKRDDFVHNFENVMKLVQVYGLFCKGKTDSLFSHCSSGYFQKITSLCILISCWETF